MHPFSPATALTLAFALAGAVSAEAKEPSTMSSFFDLETKTLEGKAQPLSEYRGKVVLVVNVASACGFTPQYSGLQKLHTEYGEKGLVVLGFPSNEFGGQEPGSSKEIRTFCETKFGVTFPMFEKVETKKGPGQHPIYQFLTAKEGQPKWNFHKYLVSRDGQVLDSYSSMVAPDSSKLIKAIESALAKK